MPSQHLRSRSEYGLGSRAAARELMNLLGGEFAYSTHYYVDAMDGNDTVHSGLSSDKAFATMSKAFENVTDNGVIHLRGPITETLTAPDGITGVTIIGDGSSLRHGSTSNVAEGYAAAWHDDAEAPLLQIHSQGWTLAGILFAPHSGDSAIEILSDSGEDPEHTGGNLRIIGCRFSGGEYGIEDNGGSGFVRVIGNRFESCTIAAIANVSTSNALPLQWDVMHNVFANGNAHHIDAPASKWTIAHNWFHTVSGTDHYIDLTGGGNNAVGPGNFFMGTYAHDDYQDASGDLWAGNYIESGVTSANPAA